MILHDCAWRISESLLDQAAETAGRGNRRLKQLVADLSLDKVMLHDVLAKKL
jgi:hypothetical protein